MVNMPFRYGRDSQMHKLHYITLTPFQTPPTPEVTSGASTITCYTKYRELLLVKMFTWMG